jgi:hypothetical protein
VKTASIFLPTKRCEPEFVKVIELKVSVMGVAGGGKKNKKKTKKQRIK